MGVRERRDGAITVITIDRPQAHNAVDHATAVELADAIRRFGANDDAAILVLTGAGPTSFCAGADLKGIPELLGDDEFCTTVGPMGFAKLDPASPPSPRSTDIASPAVLSSLPGAISASPRSMPSSGRSTAAGACRSSTAVPSAYRGSSA